VDCFRVQFQTKCSYNFENCVEAWTSFSGKRLIKAFARQAGITRHLRHALGPGDIAQSFSNESITICLLKASFKVCSHLLRGTKMFGDVGTGSFGFSQNAYIGVTHLAVLLSDKFFLYCTLNKQFKLWLWMRSV